MNNIPINFFGLQISKNTPPIVINKINIKSNKLINNYVFFKSDGELVNISGLFRRLSLNDDDIGNLIKSLSNDVSAVPMQVFDLDDNVFTSNVPLVLQSLEFNSIDMLFISKFQNKKISNFLYNNYVLKNYSSLYISTYNYFIYSINGGTVLNSIYAKYKNKWLNLAKTLNYDYDILQPFDISLNESTTDEMTVTKDLTTVTDKDGIYPFNSPTNTESFPTDDSSSTRNNEYSRQNPKTRDYTRKGNIGNKSKAQLMEEEREKAKYVLLDTILEDVSKLLTRGVWV